MLEILNLSKKYGKTLAVDQVSFLVPDGQIGVLLGPNGAGKSTIIKSIAGLVRYEGQVRIQGILGKSVDAKKVFAYVPEIPAMYEALTVREHIDFILKAYQAETTGEEIEHLLERFELADKQNKLGNELSKGMMQKVSICCALVVKPQVILLDEPMVGLDPAAIKELKKIVLELKEQGVTVLISTHMLEMVKELWDVTFVMEKGHIIGTYSKDTVGAENLEDLFFQVTSGGVSEHSGRETESSGRRV
ncbi:MAG: ABC transporter ATP-binding protein [Lachnospiraceae bacterium]|nr:ABC transporter ATP-binding protein [Lachnospiraceae bacterium]